MSYIIDSIERPIRHFNKFQENIAKKVKKIGGSGKIHGCIIDIDFYNHLYINPTDMKITAYWATDMVNKVIYSNIPLLLQEKCPNIYMKYLKCYEGKKNNPFIPTKTNQEVPGSQFYLEKDIYSVSRQIKKLQKINDKILTIWCDIMPSEDNKKIANTKLMAANKTKG